MDKILRIIYNKGRIITIEYETIISMVRIDDWRWWSNIKKWTLQVGMRQILAAANNLLTICSFIGLYRGLLVLTRGDAKSPEILDL